MQNGITDRDRPLLELLKRYRVSTSEMNVTVCGGSESSAKKSISRLKPYVASDPLGQKSVVYRPTPAGAKLMGIPEEQGRPLGPQALPKALGILGFCLEGETKRERYLRHELLEDFPEFGKEVVGRDYHTDFFLDHDGEHVRLGQIFVDLGGDYKKLISKCRVRIREYIEVPHLRDLVSDGLLAVAIVVSEEEKAEAIKLALKEKPLRARSIVETSSELKKCPIQLGGDE